MMLINTNGINHRDIAWFNQCSLQKKPQQLATLTVVCSMLTVIIQQSISSCVLNAKDRQTVGIQHYTISSVVNANCGSFLFAPSYNSEGLNLAAVTIWQHTNNCVLIANGRQTVTNQHRIFSGVLKANSHQF